ncbi:hypothetical protein EMIT0324P_11140 [Pseudomonas chlororaphis]
MKFMSAVFDQLFIFAKMAGNENANGLFIDVVVNHSCDAAKSKTMRGNRPTLSPDNMRILALFIIKYSSVDALKGDEYQLV